LRPARLQGRGAVAAGRRPEAQGARAREHQGSDRRRRATPDPGEGRGEVQEGRDDRPGAVRRYCVERISVRPVLATTLRFVPSRPMSDALWRTRIRYRVGAMSPMILRSAPGTVTLDSVVTAHVKFATFVGFVPTMSVAPAKLVALVASIVMTSAVGMAT